MQRRPENPLADRLLAAQRELNALSAAAIDHPPPGGDDPHQALLIAPQFAQQAQQIGGRHTGRPTPVVVHRRRRLVLNDQPPAAQPEAVNKARESRVFVRVSASADESTAAADPVAEDLSQLSASDQHLQPADPIAPVQQPKPRRRQRRPAEHRPGEVTVIRPEPAPPAPPAPLIATTTKLERLPAAIAREQAAIEELLEELARPRPAFSFDLGVNARWEAVIQELDELEAALCRPAPRIKLPG